MKESLKHIDSSCIFRETFNSSSDVVKNGGVINGNPTFSNGVCIFDGTGDYIIYPNQYDIKSVVLRINPDTTTEDVIDFDGGTHSVEFSTGTITATGFTAPTIYVDGTVTSTITTGWHTIVITTATAFNATALKIGQETDTYNGNMDLVEIYNRSLSAEEVSLLYNESLYKTISNDPVFFYDTRKGVGMENRGINIDTKSASATINRDGMLYYKDYNGTNYDYYGDQSALEPAQMTVMGWVKFRDYNFSSFSSVGIAVNSNVADTHGWGMALLENVGKFYFSVSQNGATADWKPVIANSKINIDTWYHIAGTYDGTNVYIYVDGTKQTDTNTATQIDYNASCYFYHGGSLAGIMDGGISYMKIYNYDIGAEMIARDYNSTKYLYRK